MLQIDGPEVELNDGASDRAGRDVAPLGSQDPQEIVEQRSADEIGDDIDRLASGRAVDALGEVAGAAGDDGLGADPGDDLLLPRADDRVGNGAARATELDEARADAARSA